MLILNDDELNETYPELNKLKIRWHEVSLEGIPAADYRKVVKEFFRNLKAAPMPDIQRLVKGINEHEEGLWIDIFEKHVTPLWKPNVLRALTEALATMQTLK